MRLPTLQRSSLILFGFSLLYAVLRLLILAGIPPTTHFDSDAYLFQYEGGFAGGMLGRDRPWGYPLLVWLLGYRLWLVVWFQRLTGIAGWLAFAWSLTILARSRAGKWFGFGGALIVSLSLAVVQWDISILTESLTLTLLAVLAALWICLLARPDRIFLLIGCWVGVSIPFAALRDANNILLPFFAIILMAYTLANIGSPDAPPAKLRRFTAGAAAAAALLAIFFFHHADLTRSGRSWPNVANVLSRRALVQEGSFGYAYTHVGHLHWLQRHYSMPDEAALRVNKGFSDPPPLSDEYRLWLRQSGARAWTHFLVAHPVWAIHEYLSDPPLLADPAREYLNPQRWPSSRLWLPRLCQTLTVGFFLGLLAHPGVHAILLFLSILFAVIWPLAACFRPGSQVANYLGVLVFLAGVATASTALAVLGDAMEIWRHGLNGTVAVFMMAPVALCAIADTFSAIGNRMEQKPSGNRPPPVNAPRRRRRAAGSRRSSGL